MKFVIACAFLCAAMSASFAQNEINEGDGLCSIVVVKDEKESSCIGNKGCTYTGDKLECKQEGAIRNDKISAYGEYVRARADRQGKNFCSICCGYGASEMCCSGKTCECTRHYQPTCPE